VIFTVERKKRADKKNIINTNITQMKVGKQWVKTST